MKIQKNIIVNVHTFFGIIMFMLFGTNHNQLASLVAVELKSYENKRFW